MASEALHYPPSPVHPGLSLVGPGSVVAGGSVGVGLGPSGRDANTTATVSLPEGVRDFLREFPEGERGRALELLLESGVEGVRRKAGEGKGRASR